MRQRRMKSAKEPGTERAIAGQSEPTACDDVPADAFGMLAGSVLTASDGGSSPSFAIALWIASKR